VGDADVVVGVAAGVVEVRTWGTTISDARNTLLNAPPSPCPHHATGPAGRGLSDAE